MSNQLLLGLAQSCSKMEIFTSLLLVVRLVFVIFLPYHIQGVNNSDLVGTVVSYAGEVVMSQNMVIVKVDMGILQTFPVEIAKLKSELLRILHDKNFYVFVPPAQLSLAMEILKLMERYLPPVVQQEAGRRSKRSLLPVIGSVLHDLFGVATDESISGVNHKLENLDALINAQGGALESSLDVVNRHGVLLKELKNKFHGAIQLLDNRTKANFDTIMFGDRLNSLFTSCSLLVSDFRSLIDGLALAARGVVSQSLLPYGELVRLIKMAQEKFKFNSLFAVKDLDHYYSLLSSEILGNFVVINIPFSSTKQFVAYRIIPFPSLLNGTQVILSGGEKLVVVSKDLESMSFPNRADFEGVCFSNSHLLHVCPSTVLSMSPSHLHMCERDILIRGKMGHRCKFVAGNVSHVEVVHVDNFYHLFFPFPTTINLLCPGRAAESIEVLGGYVLQDSCDLSSKEMRLYASNRQRLIYNVTLFDAPLYAKSFSSMSDDGLVEILNQVEEVTVPSPLDRRVPKLVVHPVWSTSGTVMSTIVFPLFVVLGILVVIVMFRRHGARLTSLMLDYIKPNTGPVENDSISAAEDVEEQL